MAYNYTSINIKPEQHKQLKRIAAFKGCNVTQLGVEMAEEYLEKFLSKHGDVMAEMEELEERMAQLRVQFREPNAR